MKRLCGIGPLALVSIAASLAFGAASASAETWLCVPTSSGKAVTSGGTGKEAKCEKETTLLEEPSSAEQSTLLSILKYIKFEEKGIDGKPTVIISGANLQVVNGEKMTASTNGEGNLIIGYDEVPGTQTGSHNLILGSKQTFTKYGGILAGWENTISGAWASVIGGEYNTASGVSSSVTGGKRNTAEGAYASVAGGEKNTARGSGATVSGGSLNEVTATGSEASVSGGSENTAYGFGDAITGGRNNYTKEEESTVIGGLTNHAIGNLTLEFGGKSGDASAEWEACGGYPTIYC
jgi:hypothetical protein